MSRHLASLAVVILVGTQAIGAPSELKCDDPNFDRKQAEALSGKAVAGKPTKAQKDHRPSVKKTTGLEINGKKVAVNYHQYAAIDKPKQGTAIFLCGGPGQSCVADGPPESIPSTFDVVVFDYLGIGENRAAGLTGELMSIEAQAKVTEGLINKLNLKEYVLYGNSMGTAVATVAGAELTHGSSKTPKPKALILEGALGKAGVYGETLPTVSARAWSLLKPAEQKAFLKTYDETVKGLTKTQKKSFDQMLVMDPAPQGAKAIADSLRSLGSDSARFRKEILASEKMKPTTAVLQALTVETHHYRGPGCQVNTAAAESKPFLLFENRVSVNPSETGRVKNPCACPLVSRLYDSAAHKVKDIPIVYISGKTDLITPPDDSAYHVEHQIETKDKILLSVIDGGHGEMMGGVLTPCSPEIMVLAMNGAVGELRKKASKLEKGICPEVSDGAPTKKSRANH